MNYQTGVVLGDKYIDKQTGMTGTATAVVFFQFGCERVTLETVHEGAIKEYTFDSPRLTHVETDTQITTERTGGPDRGVSWSRPCPATR
jgi:hypothetical protein